jgi:hypothetical protein
MEAKMTLLDLKDVRFVLDANGKQSAVQVSIKDWKTLLEYLEEVEDRAAVKARIARLRNGPEQSGALDWQEIQ